MKKLAFGRSLIELMISLAIGLVVIIAALAIFSSTSRGGKVAQLESRLNENALITLNILQQQLRVAGYGAIVGSPTFVVRKNFAGASVRGCTGGFSNATNSTIDVLACNNDTTLPDAIVIRYEADASNTVQVSGRPSNCLGEAITSSWVSDASSTYGFPTYARADNRYFVKSAGTPSGGPELYCTGSVSTPTTATFGQTEPLTEGVEGLSFTYGVAASALGTYTVAYMSAQDIDTQWSAETVDARWARVVSVRICVLMRSDEPGDVVDATYKDCSNTVQTSADRRLRRAYTTTVALRNRLL